MFLIIFFFTRFYSTWPLMVCFILLHSVAIYFIILYFVIMKLRWVSSLTTLSFSWSSTDLFHPSFLFLRFIIFLLLILPTFVFFSQTLPLVFTFCSTPYSISSKPPSLSLPVSSLPPPDHRRNGSLFTQLK